MIVGVKDGMKLIAISIMACCAVFVCTLFLNYNIDFAGIEEQIINPQMIVLYEALISVGKVVSMVSGGCLLLTSAVMLVFYIKNYVDTHKKELGILKALGYSNFQIAKSFWVFSISVLIGTSLGFGGAFLMMPAFYRQQSEGNMLPEVAVHFHPILVITLIVLPTIAFGLLAIFYACIKLRHPTIDLLKEKVQYQKIHRQMKNSLGKSQSQHEDTERSFLEEVKRATLRSKKALVFFVVFGSFCYSAMMQMSGSMDEIASEMFAIMTFAIGVILASITLFLAMSAVLKGNTKSISMMRVFGYRLKDCKGAVLGGYRPWAYLGFAIGTVYQYGLLKIVLNVVFRDVENIPEYDFDVQMCIIVLISFVILYELLIYFYTRRIRKISIKEVMME